MTIPNIQKIYGIVLTLLIAVTISTGCGEPSINSITARTDNGHTVLDVSFSAETAYTVSSVGDGDRIVLTAPGVVLSRNVAAERLITAIPSITGWFAHAGDDGAEVIFHLSEPDSFSYAHGVADGRFAVRIAIGQQTVNTTSSDKKEILVETTRADTAQEQPDIVPATPLARAVIAFNAGRLDESLVALRDVVGSKERCPLAYYYAARIRLVKKQYSRAHANLVTALRDSASFTDATGYLAFTLKRLGRNKEAASAWRSYLSAAEFGDDVAPPDTIMPPDRFLASIDSVRKAREQAQKALAETGVQPIPSSAESGETGDDNPAEQNSPEAGVSPQLFADDETDAEPGNDFQARIRTDIRRGVYGIIIATSALILGLAGMVYYLRKRRRNSNEISFGGEIDAILGDTIELPDIEQPSLSDEDNAEVFEEKRRAMGRTPARFGNQDRPVITPLNDVADTPPRRMVIEDDEPEPPKPQHFLAEAGTRQPITEEIKSLVTRMHREGHSLDDICRASDLTRTEAELIIAVRARQVDRLVEEASVPIDDEHHDTDDTMYAAIRELRADGVPVREIARRLGVSTSEVSFAMAVIDGEGRHSG